MGWAGVRREPGLTHAEFFKDEFKYKDAPEAGLIDIKAAGQKTAYAAVRHPRGYVFACVILMYRDSSDYYNFNFKTIDETCGPLETNCPRSILNLLTPDEELLKKHPEVWTVDGHWLEWRNACRANLKKRATLKHGSILKLPYPLSFPNGEERDTFQLNREKTLNGGTRTVFTPPGSAYPRYRLTNWRQLNYEVIEQPD